MKRRKSFCKAIRILAAGLWLAGWTACPSRGEANAPVPANNNVADRIWNTVRQEETPGGTVQNQAFPQKPAVAGEPNQNAVRTDIITPPVQPVTGYTEAEIRARLIKKYTLPRPAFRRVSGVAAGADYRPGTMDVKIPILFFPPDEMKDASEAFPENPDGSLGTRGSDDMKTESSGYSAEAQKQLQLQEEQMRKVREKRNQTAQAAEQKGIGPLTGPDKLPGRPAGDKGAAVQGRKVKAGPKHKTITVQVPVLAPSPFRVPEGGDFRWFTNGKGRYMVALPLSMPYDPLQKLPAFGPMMLRNTSQNEFMAVTVDDPQDTYYYKNQDSFPDYGKAVPVFTETRKNIQGDDVSIKYIRRYLGGEYCLLVDSTGKRAGKTYRVAIVFPESKQYEYLPKALFIIENLKGF